MSVSVGIIIAQMLQDAHLTDIRAQRKQSTPTDAADAEMLTECDVQVLLGMVIT